MDKHKKVKGSDTIVISDSYGQAVDDFISIWNKDNRMNMDIGYPVVQGKPVGKVKEMKFSKQEQADIDEAVKDEFIGRKKRDGELKLVKGAHLENHDGMYKLIHYGTQIFSFDPTTSKAIVQKNLSRTSNKQIKMALEFFDPKNIENIEADEKWKFGGNR